MKPRSLRLIDTPPAEPVAGPSDAFLNIGRNVRIKGAGWPVKRTVKRDGEIEI